MAETKSKRTGKEDREYKTRMAETESRSTGKQDTRMAEISLWQRHWQTRQRLNPKVQAKKTENTRQLVWQTLNPEVLAK